MHELCRNVLAAETKVVAAILATVFVPSALLTWFGLVAIDRERVAQEELFEQRATGAAENAAARMDRLIRRLNSRAATLVDGGGA